uniref:2-octaprenylphenol hydroxylase ) n=1 Tax=Ganoderma boninense TaxID=34458 RepID=A0A5K1K5I4_9APHY|nr:2-octaprenylphenol hydroxylase (EC (2-polyprenylphenol 6-hydroxylase) [Ganoderma boninense]
MTTLSGLDTWSVISGAIGVLTVLPFVWAYVRSQHPETKLAELDSTLNDTEALLRSVIEEGLFHPVGHVPHFESRLRNLRAVADKLRDDTFIASVEWRKLLRAWYDGLTKQISAVCIQVKGVRANICETSASLRMQLPHADDSAPLPSHRRWRAKIVNFWRRILSLARLNRVFVVDDAGDSTPVASSTSTFDTITIVPSLDDAGSDIVAWDGDASTPEPDARSCLAPSRNNSLDHLSKPPRACSHTPRTASRTHELRVISRAIRQVDRELASQGVTNARLAQLVQAMHMRWSPASSKARRLPRRLCKQHGPKHVLALQRTSDSATDIDPDEDGEWEETMCKL